MLESRILAAALACLPLNSFGSSSNGWSRYLAGITGEGEDIATQTADILSKVDALLAVHGSSKHRLLSATLYITDLSLRPAANKVWTAWLPEGDEPARTSAAASALMPGELIEIVFTAATTDSGPIRRHGRNPGTYHVRPHTSVLMLLRITSHSPHCARRWSSTRDCCILPVARCTMRTTAWRCKPRGHWPGSKRASKNASSLACLLSMVFAP